MSNKVYTIDETKNIVEPIAKSYCVQRIFLFGSYARWEATFLSDLDFRIDRGALKGIFAKECTNSRIPTKKDTYTSPV